MTLEEFEAIYYGKRVDFNGQDVGQCVDLVQLYNRDVVKAPRLVGNAKDLANNTQPAFYDYIKNTLFYIPPKGSIAVWNDKVGGGYGHTAIVISANVITFVALGQNWPIGSGVHRETHNYKHIDGFLVPKKQPLFLDGVGAAEAIEEYQKRARTVIQNAINTLNTLM